MLEQDRQEQIAETLSLLNQMTPAVPAADRDHLFFRAGEASARGEMRASSRTHRVVWPAAAAGLALLATMLGAALVMHEPKVEVVYIEPPANETAGRTSTAGQDTPRDRGESQRAAELAASVYGANEIRHWPHGNGIIHRQDWAALSDAFAGQLRLQQERSQAAKEAMLSATVENGGDALERDAPRQRGQSYLELRDAMKAM